MCCTAHDYCNFGNRTNGQRVNAGNANKTVGAVAAAVAALAAAVLSAPGGGGWSGGGCGGDSGSGADCDSHCGPAAAGKALHLAPYFHNTTAQVHHSASLHTPSQSKCAEKDSSSTHTAASTTVFCDVCPKSVIVARQDRINDTASSGENIIPSPKLFLPRTH